MARQIDEKTLAEITSRGVSEIIVESEFIRLLKEGKPLRLKMGFDPSRPDIHLGHVVGLRKLRKLQQLGHEVVLIVGDWTAQIGDPTGESITRPMLSHEEVIENAKTYMQQFFKVIDPGSTKTVWQSEWFGEFTLANVVDLTRRFTVAQFLDRDDFSKRFHEQKPIAITELLYPLLQAYDSVVVKADVEFGGTDQKFNLLVGRELQQSMGQKPQHCFLMPILPGTDGIRKMSKSLGNYIAVEDPPYDMYGKVMSLPDELILLYYTYLTDVPIGDIDDMRDHMNANTVNPMEFKKDLAFNITEEFHGFNNASEASRYFERTIQGKGIPGDMPEYSISQVLHSVAGPGVGVARYRLENGNMTEVSLLDILVFSSAVNSRSEAKRLLQQGGVEINGSKVDIDHLNVAIGSVVKVGKRNFFRVIK